MSKDQSKDEQGEGAKLVGSPEKIIDMLFLGDKERKRVGDQIINRGSKHKQVLRALLLKRLLKLVQTIEQSSGTKFEMQEGFEVKVDRSDKNKERVLPVIFPINLGSAVNEKKIIKAISQAPEHEALVHAVYIQVVEWAIKASAKISQA